MHSLLIIFILAILFTVATDRQPHKKVIGRWANLFYMKTKYLSRYTDQFEVDIINNVMYISKYNKAVHNEKEYLYSVAHEFGHLIDAAYREYYFEEEELYEKLTDREAVYSDEVRAWKIAKVLLQNAEAYDAKVFNDLRKKCLKEYKDALKLTCYRRHKK